MEPIFDFLSETVGWLEDEIAFSDAGRPVAFVSGGSVFAALSGHYLGRFDDGVFCERLGWESFVMGCEAHWPWETRL